MNDFDFVTTSMSHAASEMPKRMNAKAAADAPVRCTSRAMSRDDDISGSWVAETPPADELPTAIGSPGSWAMDSPATVTSESVSFMNSRTRWQRLTSYIGRFVPRKAKQRWQRSTYSRRSTAKWV